jgi:hypothetical protein
MVGGNRVAVVGAASWGRRAATSESRVAVDDSVGHQLERGPLSP